MNILKAIPIFILARLREIGGGYFVWLCFKEGEPWWCGVLGGLIFAFYGVVATWPSLILQGYTRLTVASLL